MISFGGKCFSVFVVIMTVLMISVSNMRTKSFDLSHFSRSSRIINGTIAKYKETRHQVSIRLKFGFSGNTKHICGGSLISSSIVLTAAHCLFSSNDMTALNETEIFVVMGTLNRVDMNNSTSYEISRYEIPDTFNISTYRDDICILFLAESVPLDYLGAQPIPINWNTRIVYDTICQVTGWGETEEGSLSPVLRVLDVPLIDGAICKESFGPLLQDSMLCAGYMEGGRDACFGDSGGPLVCNGALTGVVSTGLSCALPNYPGIYTNVATFGDWIRILTGIHL